MNSIKTIKRSPHSSKNLTRVVVTGLGIVSPIGLNVRKSWENLLNGVSGIKPLDESYQTLPCKIAGSIPNLEKLLSKNFQNSELRTMAPSTALALISAKEALSSSKWNPTEAADKENTGVAVGIGMVDLNDICKTNEELVNKGYKRVSPYFVPRILPNMAAGHISIKYGFRGPNHSVSTACATGAHAVGDAFRLIRNGDAKVMISGGAESCISPLSIAGFCRLRALSTSFNDSPTKASRPFDQKRDGFVMGEGSAIIILEELQHALDRNAEIHAEILGYGLSGDASHLTAPSEDGRGAYLAMSRALKDAVLNAGDVGYVNAHATSTPLGDLIESKAIRELFKDHVTNVKVSSTKGSHGHLLGAAGNLESAFTVLACSEGKLPPTINLETIDENMKLNYVANESEEWNSGGRKRVALKNAFGFGGTNACLCIAEFRV